MKTSTDQRGKSGDVCVEPGWYEFDGYLDGTTEPRPGLSELDTWLAVGDEFPLLRKQKKECFWKLVDGLLMRTRDEAQTLDGWT